MQPGLLILGSAPSDNLSGECVLVRRWSARSEPKGSKEGSIPSATLERCWRGRVNRRSWGFWCCVTSWRSCAGGPAVQGSRGVIARSCPRCAVGLVRPETVPGWHPGWHRQLIARRWTYAHRMPGRPPLERSLRALIVRLAEENTHWGYRRIVGELKGLGVVVSPTSVRKVPIGAGLPPAPKREGLSWRAFLRQQAASTLACDFLTVETAFLQRIYVLFFISLATQRIEYIASTSKPVSWTRSSASSREPQRAQAAR